MGYYFGLIMELTEIQAGELVTTENLFGYVGKLYKFTIFGYIFMSLNEVPSRNTFVSQIIFPELIKLIKETQDAETFEISGKPLFFINFVNKRITARTILKDLELIRLVGINIIHLFDGAELDIDLSRSIGEFNAKYSQNIYNYSESTNEISLKLDELQRNILINNNGSHYYQGSSEKFYFLSALCIAKFACNIGVRLNLDEINRFRTLYANELANPNNSKFAYTDAIFKYLEKLSKKKEYFNV